MSNHSETQIRARSSFILQTGESVLLLAGMWNRNDDGLFLLEQRSGSRQKGTSASLRLTRYGRDGEIQKTREIALFKKHREAEISAKLTPIGRDALLLVFGGAQLDSILLGPEQNAYREDAIYGFVIGVNLDEISRFAIYDTDPNSLVVRSNEEDIFVAGHTRCDTGGAVVTVGGVTSVVTRTAGAFIANIHVNAQGNAIALYYGWGMSFGASSQPEPSTARESATPLRRQEAEPASLLEKLQTVDKALKLRTSSKNASGTQGAAKELLFEEPEPEQMILDLAIHPVASRRVVVVGQYRGAVAAGAHALASQRDANAGRSWVCVIDADGTVAGLWDIAPNSAKDASVLVESVVVADNNVFVAGRADGVVAFDQPRSFTSPLPEMTLPGTQRGGFVTCMSLPQPNADFSHKWTVASNLIFSPKLTMGSDDTSKLYFSGFFWKDFKLFGDSHLLARSGSGNLSQFVIVLTDKGEVADNHVLDGVEFQRSPAVAVQTSMLVTATLRPFHQTIGCVLIYK